MHNRSFALCIVLGLELVLGVGLGLEVGLGLVLGSIVHAAQSADCADHSLCLTNTFLFLTIGT